MTIGTEMGNPWIAPGFEAGLVVLDANPLGDIRNNRGFHAVILGGRILAGEQLAELKGECN